MMIYRPLFWTSYWCEDWLFTSSNYHNGCDTILISSASSKTAFCFAYCVRNRRVKQGGGAKPSIIGLTSKRNVAFTKKLELYDEVYDYDNFTSTDSFNQGGYRKRWIYVDVTGNTDLNGKVVDHFTNSTSGGELVVSISLGATNTTPEISKNSKFTEEDAKGIMGNASSTLGLPASGSSTTTTNFWPKLERFFTPEWVDVRRRQMSLSEIFELQRTEWHKLEKDCVPWIEIERVYGPKSVKESYERIVRSGLGPDKGLVWSLWEKPKRGEKAKL
ncbi:hypothetical protein E1B28_003294 [Marasmius oreades]|uniref:Uncharacterized protein n=1 Tax=Marasmius oreades TaxID=181124 RepID=A0A9P7RL17_9AGAR|nr:uncharacterized protein E1B28_003294 [Marasmius oreades]KAG7085751.1 hypothetical protein E1B28_003294 [Marasmius oreades]